MAFGLEVNRPTEDFHNCSVLCSFLGCFNLGFTVMCLACSILLSLFVMLGEGAVRYYRSMLC